MQPCIECGNRKGCCWNCCPNAVKANAYDQLRVSLDKAEELNDWFNKRCAWYQSEIKRLETNPDE